MPPSTHLAPKKSPAYRLAAFAWLIAPIFALGFILYADRVRIQRVDAVSAIAREDAQVDARSPTGYADAKRWLIIPEHNNHSYQWIAETQQMLAKGEWRVRRIDYENAPYGREVHTASPYRWWLGAVAWVDEVFSGRPLGQSVERAAIWADPLLHFFLLVSATGFVYWQFGAFSAAVVSLGLVALFPLGAAFLPGAPDDHGLVQCCALYGALFLLAGLRKRAIEVASKKSPPSSPEIVHANKLRVFWFFAAGVAGGIGLWINAANQSYVIAGLGLGAFLAEAITRLRRGSQSVPETEAPPWRLWALGGALTCLVAYLIEYFPAHMDMILRVNHPLYGLAWLGLGELLDWFSSWMRGGKVPRSLRRIIGLIFALSMIAALPVAMHLSENRAFLAGDMLETRLTNLSDGVVADSFSAWIKRDGFGAAPLATILPLLLLIPALWMLFRRKTNEVERTSLAFVLGPVLLAAVLSFSQLRWWSVLDILILAPLVVITAGLQKKRRTLWFGSIAVIYFLSLIQLVPHAPNKEQITLTKLELEGLYERALAHWLADHSKPGEAVVFAPPDRTASFCFYGGLRGLGTQNWENRDGISATFRIATATKPEEALALLTQRGVTHLVIPSWDPDLDVFAKMSLKQPEDAFIYALHRWVFFNWLRPLPYKLPVVEGFEGQSAVIFEVTEETEQATAISRLTEYFVEMQQVEFAVKATEALRRYPGNLSALIATAQVEKANADAAGFTKTFNTLVSILSTGADRALPWDRRVNLAVVLALGGRNDLSRAQIVRCLAEIDETKIRDLTTGSLYHFQVLCHVFGVNVANQQYQALALRLLPAELRSRL